MREALDIEGPLSCCDWNRLVARWNPFGLCSRVDIDHVGYSGQFSRSVLWVALAEIIRGHQ
jgi:hypothetical protein